MGFLYMKLRGRIVEKFGTQANFADALGVSQNTLSRKLSKSVGLSSDDILTWCELLDIDREEIGLYFFS